MSVVDHETSHVEEPLPALSQTGSVVHHHTDFSDNNSDDQDTEPIPDVAQLSNIQSTSMSSIVTHHHHDSNMIDNLHTICNSRDEAKTKVMPESKESSNHASMSIIDFICHENFHFIKTYLIGILCLLLNLSLMCMIFVWFDAKYCDTSVNPKATFKTFEYIRKCLYCTFEK